MKRKNYTLNITENIYTTIDEMPIWNWNKIYTTGEMRYLYKNLKGKNNEYSLNKWQELQNEYINKFGLDDSFKQKLRLMKKAIQLNCDFVIKKDRFILNELAIVESQIENFESIKSMDFYEIKDYVEKYKGFRIDPKTTTVTEYFFALKNMRNGKAD